MESWSVAHRATEVAHHPVRAKRNRRHAAKRGLAEAAETGLETSLDADHLALETEVDESRFARLSADMVMRGRDARPFGLASPPADASKSDLHESSFLGSTAGLFVYKGEAKGVAIEAPRAKAGVPTGAGAALDQADGELRRLRDEVAALRATLADRENAQAQAAQDQDQRRESWELESQAAARLAEAEAKWEEDSATALAAVRAEADAARDQAERELRSLRDEMATLQSTLVDRETALANADLDHARARESWQHESQAAEQAWKTAEAARDQAEGELRRLRDETVALRSTLADRETALAQAALDHERASKSWQHASQSGQHEWEVAEAARLAEAEAKWQEQSARALADLGAQAEAVRDRAAQELQSLRDELAGLRTTLADRETALARTGLDHEQARARWREESQAASSKAEQAWRLTEAVRLAEAEAKWQEQSAQALTAVRAEAEAKWQEQSAQALTAVRAEAEAKWQQQSAQALTAVRAEAATARSQAEENIRRLQDELAALKVALAERETALAAAASETEHVRERGRQELEAALVNAKTTEAGEAARFAAAQAEWRKQSANALAEATARYQTAEGMLTQIRMQSDRARSDAVGGSSKSTSRASFGAKTAAREPEAPAIRLPTREERGSGTQDPLVVLRPKPVLADPEAHAPRKRRTFRDIVVVGSLAIVVIVGYPSVEPFLPENLRANIAAIMGRYAPSPNVTVQGFASVVSDANLRVGPSTTARVITTLPSGLRVATVERRGDWTFVQIEGDNRNSQPRRGWVFGSLLKDETDDVEDDVETQSPDEPE